MNKYDVSVGSFVEQINNQLRNSDDIVVSIETCSGIDRQYVYVIHCKDGKGENYDININVERKRSGGMKLQDLINQLIGIHSEYGNLTVEIMREGIHLPEIKLCVDEDYLYLEAYEEGEG